MDEAQFDTILRGLTTARSRRGTMVGLLGGTVGWLGLTEGEAKHKKKHKKKHGGSPPASPPASPPPPSGCLGGTTSCGGVCANLQSDTANCGTCGNVCPAQQVCCAGVCRSTKGDATNCGTCGNVCPGGNFGTCSDGQCCIQFDGPCTDPAQCCSGFCTQEKCE
jgi:hypothetical protein